MKILNGYSLLAISAGAMLACMIYLNTLLAAETSAINASWFAHGIGALTALGLLKVLNRKQKALAKPSTNVPKVYYLGGVPGAFTVVLAAIVVSSWVGLAGTLALALVGQLVFSIVCEHYGFLQLKKRRFSLWDALPVLLVTAGSFLLIFTRS